MTTSKEALDLSDEMESLGLPLSDDQSIRCVFSTMEEIKVGTGTTTQKHTSKQYFFVEHVAERTFAVRPLNDKNIPSGEETTITLEELLEKYSPEVDFFETKTIPAMELLDEHLDDGDAEREDGKLYSAERHYNKALGMDMKNARALFSLGLVYLEMNEEEKARDMMSNILNVRTAFAGKNEHLFNEFGISLRKAGMYNEAVTYYTQATKYAPRDQNLYYNLARAEYERDNWEGCVSALGMCYAIDPEMKASSELFSIILRLNKKPELCEQLGKPPVPKDVIGHIRDIYRGENPFAAQDAAIQDDLSLTKTKQDDPERGRARSGKGKKQDAGEFNFNLD